MTDDNKIYTAEIIQENPIPGVTQVETVETDHGSATNQIYTQTTIKEQAVPTPKIATMLLSAALNTKSRKILQEFQFTPSGAIQIGNYKDGLAGDIRISPTGIVARNVNGDTTFVLDGESGDAVFSGTIQTGTLISGRVAVGDGNIVIDGETNRQLFYDADGIPSIIIGLVS